MIEATSTIHLILPSSPGRHVSGARSISSSASQESPVLASSASLSASGTEDSNSRPRSLSTSASQSQEVVEAESGASSPLPPLDGISIGQSQSSVRASVGRDNLEGAAAKALDKLFSARYSDKDYIKRSSIDIYQKSPKDHFSTPAFNAAMQLAIELKEDESTEKVLELYQQMINANCLPNRKTYAHLVRALCDSDQEQHRTATEEESTLSTADYHQALAFIDVAHSSSHGFDSVHPYNSALRSCAIRGDAETACAIIDKLSANKYVTPTAQTFLNLLDAFRRSKSEGTAPEVVLEVNARKLQSCEHIFNEFEVFRSSIGWDSKGNQDAAVWGTMIGACFQLGSPDMAVALIQKMMEGEPLSEGKKAAPRPINGTSKSIILSLLRSGDAEGALSWFERILALNSDVKEGQQSIMPLPDAPTTRGLFQNLLQLIPSVKNGSLIDDATLLNNLPLVIKMNRILNLVYDGKQQNMEDMFDEISEEAVGLRNLDWRTMLAINSDYGSRLINQGRLAEASTLSDFSLSHIKRHYDLYANQMSYASIEGMRGTLRAERVGRLRRSVRALLQVIQLLLQQDRFHDAASCFSYAVATWPPEDWHAEDIRMSFNEVGSAAFAIMGYTKTIEEASIYNAMHWELKPEANLKVHAHVALTYIFPAVQQRMSLPVCLKIAARFIYLAARQQHIEAAELNLDVRGWNYLIECVISEGFGKGGIDKALLELLVNDLETLSEADRDQLSLQKMVANLPAMIDQQEALGYLHRLRPALMAEVGFGEATPMQDTAESSMGSVTDGQGQLSATEPASPTTTQTSMASPETASEYNASLSYALPPIMTIDADMGLALMLEIKSHLKGKRFPANGRGGTARPSAAGIHNLYQRLTTSIREQGVYSTPDGICELMNQFGRNGSLEKVKELYLIGQHVVAALGGDPAWQMQSWYELEDTMMAALAHGGDHRLANAHRIALLQGGHVPKADTYAALITTIRDTTDDVMVAEELFDESQRLGVQPTLYLFNTVLSKLSRARKADRAMQLFEEMRNRGVQPSSITYGAVLNACTRTGDEVNAERFFAMMESDAQFRPKAPPYNTMLQFYTQTKPDRQKALLYYEKALSKNVEHTSHTYKLLLDMYGTIKPIDEAGMRNVFGKLIADAQVNVQGNHWASLIWAHGEHLKDLDKAIEIYESIPTHPATVRAGNRGKEPDALAFEALLGVMAENKRIDLIEEQLRKREKTGCELTAYVANVVIKAYATLVPEVGLERARQVFEKMQDPPVGMAAAGNHPLQRQHVSGVQHEEELSQQFKGADNTQLAGFERIKREPSTFEAMIRAEMEHGNVQEATALIHRMQTRGYPPIVVAHAHDILVQQPATSTTEQ